MMKQAVLATPYIDKINSVMGRSGQSMILAAKKLQLIKCSRRVQYRTE
jgi:hypothetical protein